MSEKTIEEYRGIRDLVAAELLTDTLEELTYGTVFSIAGIAELTRATENSSESHYYDNVAAVVIDSVGADTVTCNTSAIPFDVLAKLTGQYYDTGTETLVEGEINKPYFAIGYITEDTSGHEVYVWRHKVKCSIPDATHSTKNNGTDANGQQLVFTGVNTIHKFTKTGRTAKAINHKAGDLISEANFFETPQDIDTLNALTPVTPTVTGITVSPTTAALIVDGTTNLTATLAPEGVTGTVVWASTDEEVATVEDGVVTAVSEGTCTIIATCEGYAASCAVTVTTE